MKLSWLVFSLILFMLAMSYSDFVFTFKSAVFTAFLLEGICLYFYQKFQPFNGISYEETDEIDLNSSQSFVIRSNARRKTAIPCLCTTDNFRNLTSGKEEILADLHKNLKELIENDKIYWSAIEKLCEVSVFERIQQKSRDLSDLLKVLGSICKFNLNETKEIEESMLLAVKLIEKDVKKNQKRLCDKLKKSGEVYLQELNRAKMFRDKVEKYKKELAVFKGNLEQSLGKPEHFDLNLKLESKIRILSNKVSKNRHKVEICKDNLLKESGKYLDSAKRVYNEFLDINRLKGESYRSNIQCYLTNIHESWKQSHSEILPLIEESSSVSDTSRVQEDDIEKSLKKPSVLLQGLKDQMTKLDKLIESFGNIEKDYMRKFINIFRDWNISSDIGIESGYFDFTHSIEVLKENLQEFQKECDFIRQGISLNLKSFSSENEENLLTQSNNFFESKKLFLSIILSNLSEKIKIISAGTKNFEVNDEIKEVLSFCKISMNHTQNCPYFTDGIVIDVSKNQEKNTETSPWINTLLHVYLEEWKGSYKFQEYICKKLAKKLDKDNPKFIGSISVRDFSYSGSSPYIRDFLCKSDSELEFNYEIVVTANGEVTFTVKVPLNFGFFNFEIEMIVRIKEFSGKIRLCYTSEDDNQSWYSFADMPRLTLEIYPRVQGKWIDVNGIEAIRWIISKLLILKLRRYIYPMKRSVKIPKGRPKKPQYP